MKKNSKRILVARLAAAMALSMTACSQEPGDEPSSSEPESSVSEQASEPEPSDPEVEEEPGSDVEAETSEPAAEEPGSGADTGSSAASQPAADTTSQPAANQSGSQAGASGQAPAAQTQQPASTQTGSSATGGQGPLAKYVVNVQDSTTPAVSVSGRTINGKSAYYFYSADGEIVGDIPNDQLFTIIGENGLSYAEDDEQKAWFVENFNIYRGLDEGSSSSGSSSSSSGSTGSSGSSSSDFDVEEYREEVFRLINEEREAEGLSALVMQDTAMEFAQIRAEEIADNFSHTRPDGSVGQYSHYTFMENIGKGQDTPKDIVDAWMKSSGHRATILGDYSDYGNCMGVGVYQDNGTICWVTEFILWDANA